MTDGDATGGRTAEHAVIDQLRAATPPAVVEVCRALTEAGHEAVAVGGAIRDVLLGRPAGDWDVGTSARPDAVVALFARTIPTGLQHGTVTVMAGKGRDRLAIEVTTYRGEGAYVDGRRPTEVHFGVPLVEDLARRDLVVNAIAFDPVRGVLHDPFDGRGDLAARRLRAVGDAAERFTEDGLRVVRAIRFAATLGFELDAATEAAIPAALPSLAKVSRERVKVELDKLLGAPRPGPALEIARRTGVLAQDVPEAEATDGDEWHARRAWIDAAPLLARMAILVVRAGPARAEQAMRRLKAANDERDRVVRLAKILLREGLDETGVRRALVIAGRALAPLVVDTWRARGTAGEPEGERLGQLARRIVERGDPLAAGELAVTGAALMAALGLAPGPAIGRALAACFEAVVEDPARNTPEALVEVARAAIG